MKSSEFFKILLSKENRFNLLVSIPLWALLLRTFFSFINNLIDNSLGNALKSIPYIGIILSWYITLLIMGILFIYFNELIQHYLKAIFKYIIKRLRS